MERVKRLLDHYQSRNYGDLRREGQSKRETFIRDVGCFPISADDGGDGGNMGVKYDQIWREDISFMIGTEMSLIADIGGTAEKIYPAFSDTCKAHINKQWNTQRK